MKADFMTTADQTALIEPTPELAASAASFSPTANSARDRRRAQIAVLHSKICALQIEDEEELAADKYHPTVRGYINLLKAERSRHISDVTCLLGEEAAMFLQRHGVSK